MDKPTHGWEKLWILNIMNQIENWKNKENEYFMYNLSYGHAELPKFKFMRYF
jgi:hypothetical protein